MQKTNAIGLRATAGRYGGTYANEADLLNVALFGQTAREWRDANPEISIKELVNHSGRPESMSIRIEGEVTGNGA